MKEKLIYGVIFLFVFVMVSGGIFYLNNTYKNIFAFDFSPKNAPDLNKEKKDNLAKQDSVKTDSTKIAQAAVKDSSVTVNDSTNTATSTPVQATQQPKQKETEIVKKAAEPAKSPVVQQVPFRLNVDDKTKAKKDSIYADWVKQTVKLYESMDSKKAAKVITGYSDNIARDILLKMKKKKAAEILAELKPQDVTRIISVN